MKRFQLSCEKATELIALLTERFMCAPHELTLDHAHEKARKVVRMAYTHVAQCDEAGRYTGVVSKDSEGGYPL